MSPFQHHAELTADLKVSASIHFDTNNEPYVHQIEIGRVSITHGYLFNALAPKILETLDLDQALAA